MCGGGTPEIWIVHNAIENLFVAVHPVDEESPEHAIKNVLEIIKCVDLCGCLKRLVLDRRFGNLIKEELIGLPEVGAETVIELVNELGEGSPCRRLAAFRLRSGL